MHTADGNSRDARKKLEAGTSLSGVHWAIIALSFLLTFFAWYYSQNQLDLRIQVQFDREADQVVELVKERMRKYEDALWSGVAVIKTVGGDIEYDRWKTYAEGLHLEQKYPGINGIGVIHALAEADVPKYLARQRTLRPDYQMHPQHARKEFFPISYVIPVEGNQKAVGLDMAYETNRLVTTHKSRDTGEVQITGPITLVQDKNKTPGFLLFAPYYQGGPYASVEERQKHFSGMVYAPFVVTKLMLGALEKDLRHVGIRLADGEETIYDEHVSSVADFDPDPMLKRSVEVPMYGRSWTFDIWSAKSFREASSDAQPMTIMLSGIFIDSLLIALFASITKTSKRTLKYADSMTAQLEANAEELEASQSHLAERAKQLETSNAELEQFAYVASHDLQEPLRKIASYGQLLQSECADDFTGDGREYLQVVIDGARRMKTLISDLLSFSRITSCDLAVEPVEADACLQSALENLEMAIEDSQAEVLCDPLPQVMADPGQLTHVFQNLVGNAIKYGSKDAPEIHVGGRVVGEQFEFCVRDNGIGIDPKFYGRIFEIFQRLHNRRDYSGTGIGLAICKRIVERLGGRIWLQSVPGEGSQFFFTMQMANQHGGQDAHSGALESVGSPD
jgi:signal transduction histidine kinase